MSDASTFPCPACGRPLVWLERLAGQRVRCACGTTVIVPADPNAAPVPAGQAVPVAGTIPYASTAKAAALDKESKRHLFWPAVLAGAGFVLTIIYYATALPLSFPTAMAVMSIRLAIDFVLLFGGCLLAMRLLDMALGEPLEAVIKLLGVALLPAAIEGLISFHFAGGFILGWALSLGMYGVLLMWFFSLNGKEVMTLTTVVWLVQSWGSLVISAVLLPNVLGAKLPMNGPIGWALGDGEPANTKAADTPDGIAEALLDRPDAMEANLWLLGGTHTLGGRDRVESPRVVGLLYNAGATAVHVSDVAKTPGGDVAAEVIVDLPDSAADRTKLVAVATGAACGGTIDSAVIPADQQHLVIHMPMPK